MTLISRSVGGARGGIANRHTMLAVRIVTKATATHSIPLLSLRNSLTNDVTDDDDDDDVIV